MKALSACGIIPTLVNIKLFYHEFKKNVAEKIRSGARKRTQIWKLQVLDMQKMTLDWRGFLVVVLLSFIGCTFTAPDEVPEMIDQPTPWEATALLSDQVNAIAADAEHIWVATDKGINRFIKHASLWISYTVEDGLANNKVSSVAVDGGCWLLVWHRSWRFKISPQN